ncbi:MAG TPA: pantoate--beta-alanine ligase [Acidimicrobiales bacterium]|nr:pantoate--beta-alanine ligase [Acidimicrobiales bacterium]
MLRLSDVEEWRTFANGVRAKGRTVGLVPTMGALHEGHAALFRAAKDHGDVVVATIFVNPRQFNDQGDLERYPRTPELDRSLALDSGVDCLIEPTLEAMWPAYPAPTPTTVSLGAMGELFEGAGRPGHFDGVASVVAKLFAITGPARAYFGEKDYQQLSVVRQMVHDLAFDVEVVGCAIVRDDDGLAFSSRNARLSKEGRRHALALSEALARVAGHAECASAQRARLSETLLGAGVDVAYADVVDPATLVPSRDDESGERRALVAGLVEGVRLLDNAPVRIVGR